MLPFSIKKPTASRILLFAVLFPLPHYLLAASAEVSPPPIKPVHAELVGPLDSAHTKEGSRVLALVTEDWKGDGCRLWPGAILEGHVAQVVRHTKTQKNASMAIVFDKADCNDHPSTEYKFTLIALIGIYNDPFGSLRQGAPLADSASTVSEGLGLPGSPSSQLHGLSKLASPDPDTHQFNHQRNLPARILPGQVIDIPHTSLILGDAAGIATVISTVNHDTRIEAQSTLILLPVSRGAAPSTAVAAETSTPADTSGPASAISPPAAPIAPEPPDSTELCTGICNVVSSTSSHSTNSGNVLASLPIDKLGYSPHIKGPPASFDHQTSLTYLDETHLLCTFDPHRLRIRSADANSDPVRTIRAVLIDTSTQTVTTVMEWQVRGDDSYLWRLASGHVLVHVVHQLQEFDAQLQPVRSVPIDAPLAWVVSSPSNDRLVVALRRKHYTDEVHRRFVDSEEQPDDVLEVRVYDRAFNLLSTSMRSSTLIPPVLTDHGELRIAHPNADRWKITEYGWDKTDRDLATVRSSCRPLLSVPENGLTFVTGCAAGSGNVWYRVLRPDGHPLLKANSATNELAQSADTALTGCFTVRVLKSTHPMYLDIPFGRADLEYEVIGVYSSANGSRLSSIATQDFILAQNSYALSPSGDQIALAGATSIRFYNVKTH